MKIFLWIIAFVLVSFYFFWSGASTANSYVIDACETSGIFTYDNVVYTCSPRGES